MVTHHQRSDRLESESIHGTKFSQMTPCRRCLAVQNATKLLLKRPGGSCVHVLIEISLDGENSPQASQPDRWQSLRTKQPDERHCQRRNFLRILRSVLKSVSSPRCRSSSLSLSWGAEEMNEKQRKSTTHRQRQSEKGESRICKSCRLCDINKDTAAEEKEAYDVTRCRVTVAQANRVYLAYHQYPRSGPLCLPLRSSYRKEWCSSPGFYSAATTNHVNGDIFPPMCDLLLFVCRLFFFHSQQPHHASL